MIADDIAGPEALTAVMGGRVSQVPSVAGSRVRQRLRSGSTGTQRQGLLKPQSE